jgi:hypothetical protein
MGEVRFGFLWGAGAVNWWLLLGSACRGAGWGCVVTCLAGGVGSNGVLSVSESASFFVLAGAFPSFSRGHEGGVGSGCLFSDVLGVRVGVVSFGGPWHFTRRGMVGLPRVGHVLASVCPLGGLGDSTLALAIGFLLPCPAFKRGKKTVGWWYRFKGPPDGTFLYDAKDNRCEKWKCANASKSGI